MVIELTTVLRKIFKLFYLKKSSISKVDRSIKIFSPAYPFMSELIHRQHCNSLIHGLIHPLNLISGLCKQEEHCVFSH